MSEFKYQLGEMAQDKVTGFEGVITSAATYITGCNQYCLQPKCSKCSEYPKSNWFDESRIKSITEGSISHDEVQGEIKGGSYGGAPTK